MAIADFPSGERSLDERIEAGRALRQAVPRAAHAEWTAPPQRRDPIEMLEASNEGRVEELTPIRFGRMLANPFAFLRGSAAVMAHDLATTAASGIRVQACGDCHLANFGLFATPERNLVFDINDFDETLPAPWEWDIKRLAASFAVLGRESGLSENKCEVAVAALARSYRTRLREYAEMRVLDVWYSRLDDKTLIEESDDQQVRQRRAQIARKARASVAEYLFPKLAKSVDGKYRIVDKPPLIYHLPDATDLEARMQKLLAGYLEGQPHHLRKLFQHFRIEDAAFKVVGVGSVGTRCYLLLFLAGTDDALILQVKEARVSVLEPYAGAGEFAHHGQRVVVGQRLMQSASDMFLGWATGGDGRHYYLRQLRDMKFSVPLDNADSEALNRYAGICGWVLARAHAKGGDAGTISGYLGKGDVFDKALAQFATAYAKQTAEDFARLQQAVKSGRIKATIES